MRFHDPDEHLDLSGATVVAVHRPNRVRWEIRGPVTKFFLGTERDYQYVKDGESVWAYFPKLNQYGKERVGKDAPTEGADSPDTISYLEDTFLGRTSMKAGGQTRILREERIPSNGVTADCFVLEIREGPIDIYRWWVEKGTYRVLRYEKESKDSPTANYYSMIIRFTNIQLTGPVDEKLFIFSPPAGSKRVYEPNP